MDALEAALEMEELERSLLADLVDDADETELLRNSPIAARGNERRRVEGRSRKGGPPLSTQDRKSVV